MEPSEAAGRHFLWRLEKKRPYNQLHRQKLKQNSCFMRCEASLFVFDDLK